MMRFCVLGSGSKGNATYVASGGTALLIDAGFSGVEIERRLASIGVDCSALTGILVTHEHGDHVKGVSVLSRRHQIPVYANLPTREAAGPALERLFSFQPFCTGQGFHIGDLAVHPFSISHDTADPVGFTIDNGASSLGYCTDTGHVSKLIGHHLASCHGLILECNHDLEMLRNGHYPVHVQQRVRSQKGHLANPQTLDFLKQLYHDGLEAVILAHISESNNSLTLVQQTVETFLSETPRESGEPLHMSWASQSQVSEVITLGRNNSKARSVRVAC